MINTLLGLKAKMGATYVEDTRIPVTYVVAGPCVVTQIKSQDKDGYWAVQLGFGEKRIKNVTKPLLGHLRGVIKGKKAPRFLREVRLSEKPTYKVGDQIKVSDIFKKGDVVSVTGISKGKGFAGVVKRYHFSGGPRTHGQSDRERAPGSIGQGTTPGRVYKGKKMAGRMGQDRVTIKNLVVVDVDDEKNLLAISGSLPGAKGNLLVIKKTSSGKLEELVERAPEVQVVQEEEGAAEGGKNPQQPEEQDKHSEE